LYAHRQDAKRLNAYVDTTLKLVNTYLTVDTGELIDYHTTLAMCYIPGNVDQPELGLEILKRISPYSQQMSGYKAHYADLHRARAYLYYGLGTLHEAQLEMHRAIDLFERADSLSAYHFSGYVDALLGLGIFYIEDDRRIREGVPYVNAASELYFGKPLSYVATHYPARFLKYYARWYDYLIAFGDHLIALADAETCMQGITHLSSRIDSAITASRQKVSDHDVLRNAKLNHDIYTYMIGWCHEVYNAFQDEEVLHLAFNHFEKSRAHLLLTQMSSLKLARQLGVPEAVIAQGVALAQEEVATAAYLDESGAEALLSRKQNYFTNLKSQYPDYYYKAYQPDRVSLSDLGNAIRSDEAIINYQIRDSQLYTLVITSDTLLFVSSVFNTACANAMNELFAEVSRRPSLALDDKDVLQFLLTAQDVFGCVLGNIYPVIESKRQWWIAADDLLEMLPFEILTAPSQKDAYSFASLEYLVTRHDIGYVLSATNWHAERLRPALAIQQIAAFIHSDGSHTVRSFESDRDVSRYMGMPGTARAAASIRKVYGSGNVVVFSNKHATIASFLNSLHSYELLHLGLHAFGDTTGRQGHGIVFPGDRSVLTVPDIIGKNIRASVVFLEGCETALGKHARGEGMLNFARPFVAAGARHILASRWKLDDQSAGEMAGFFYRELKANNDVAYANSEAKRMFLRHATRLQSHPYYWAAVMSVQ
jgi:CHAT domain-containing protein